MNLLAAGSEAADSSRDNVALWNDNCFGSFKLLNYVLDLRRPAVHEQFDSGDEAGIIRSQEECRLGDFF